MTLTSRSLLGEERRARTLNLRRPHDLQLHQVRAPSVQVLALANESVNVSVLVALSHQKRKRDEQQRVPPTKTSMKLSLLRLILLRLETRLVAAPRNHAIQAALLNDVIAVAETESNEVHLFLIFVAASLATVPSTRVVATRRPFRVSRP